MDPRLPFLDYRAELTVARALGPLSRCSSPSPLSRSLRFSDLLRCMCSHLLFPSRLLLCIFSSLSHYARHQASPLCVLQPCRRVCEEGKLKRVTERMTVELYTSNKTEEQENRLNYDVEEYATHGTRRRRVLSHPVRSSPSRFVSFLFRFFWPCPPSPTYKRCRPV